MDQETSSFGHDSESKASFEEMQELSCEGATSLSYKVRLWGKWFFLKRPKPEFADNPKYIAAFEKEFDLGVTLDHPHIVRYHSKGYDAEGIYFLTEYIDGVTLTEYINTRPKLSKQEALQIIKQIADALRYLHTRQIVHFDLKPDNILITANGEQVKLIDLGFAYSDCYSAIACGSPAYSAPEQFSSPETADLRVDIFALGTVIKFLTPAFPRIAYRATAANPADRYSSIDALLRDLRPTTCKWYAVGGVVIILFIAFFWSNSRRVQDQPSVVHQRDTIVEIQYVDKTAESASSINQDSIVGQKLRKELQQKLRPVASAFFNAHPVMNVENEKEVETAFWECDHNLDSIMSQIYDRYNPDNDNKLHWLWRICEDEKRNALLPYKKISGDFTAHEEFINQYKTILNKGFESIFDSVYYSSVRIGSVCDDKAYKHALMLKEKALQESLEFQNSIIQKYLQIAPADSARFYSEATERMRNVLDYHDRIIEHYKKHYQN